MTRLRFAGYIKDYSELTLGEQSVRDYFTKIFMKKIWLCGRNDGDVPDSWRQKLNALDPTFRLR